MNTPKYQPYDPKSPHSAPVPWYHTNADSWFADAAVPGPYQRPKVAKSERKPTAKRMPKKRVMIRWRKMRKAEREVVFWLILALLAKWFIFGF